MQTRGHSAVLSVGGIVPSEARGHRACYSGGRGGRKGWEGDGGSLKICQEFMVDSLGEGICCGKERKTIPRGSLGQTQKSLCARQSGEQSIWKL